MQSRIILNILLFRSYKYFISALITIVFLCELLGLVNGQSNTFLPNGNEKDITSTKFCPENSEVCYIFSQQKATNDSYYSVEYSKTSKIGWCALGTGDTMIKSDIIIVWLNDNNEPVLSSRKALGYSMPTSKKDQGLKVLKEYSALSAEKIIITFAKDNGNSINNDIGESNWIWAYSITKPKDLEQPDSTIEIHDRYGVFNLDVKSGITSASKNIETKSKVSLAHGILLLFGWNIFPYFGILFARLKHNISPNSFIGKYWFKLHYLLLGIISPLLIICGIILIISYTSSNLHFKDVHQCLGLAIFVFIFIQIGSGVVIDRLFNERRTKTPWHDKAHWFLGRILFIAAQVNIILGIILYNKNNNNNIQDTKSNIAIYIVYGLLLLAEAIIYLWFFKRKPTISHKPNLKN